MHSPVYRSLVEALAQRSISSDFQSADQLVISRQSGPAFPFPGNSFWVTHHDGQWYLSTWAPHIYRVPITSSVIELCADFVDVGDSAQRVVPDEIVARYQLIELSVEEFENLCD